MPSDLRYSEYMHEGATLFFVNVVKLFLAVVKAVIFGISLRENRDPTPFVKREEQNTRRPFRDIIFLKS